MNLYKKLSIVFLSFLILTLIGCSSTRSRSSSSKTYTHYKMTSNVPNTKVYWSDCRKGCELKYYKTTPFEKTSSESLNWSKTHWFAKKEGYKTEYHWFPTSSWGTPSHIHFNMEKGRSVEKRANSECRQLKEDLAEAENELSSFNDNITRNAASYAVGNMWKSGSAYSSALGGAMQQGFQNDQQRNTVEKNVYRKQK